MIIQPDCRLGERLSLLEIKQALSQTILQFEDALDPLRQSILVTIAHLPQAGKDLQLSQSLPVEMTGVLEAMIAVMDQALQGKVGWVNGPLAGPQSPFDGQGGGNIKAHDAAGERIGHQREVTEAGFGFEIGDVTVPDLPHPGHSEADQAVGTASQPHPGGRPFLAFEGRQEIVSGQQGRKSGLGPSKGLFFPLGLTFVPQFPTSHTRMTMPDQQHPLYDLPLLSALLLLALPHLVMGLATDTHLLTSFSHGDPQALLLGLPIGPLDDRGPGFF